MSRDVTGAVGRRVRFWMEEPMSRVAMEARVMRPHRRWRFHSFGRESVLHRPDWIQGPGKISIGERVLILGHIWLSAERQTWHRPGPALRIGDGTAIRPYCTISCAESIEIEENVVLSAFSSVVDSDHTWDADGAENIAWNSLLTTPIRIGRGTWVGERVAILRGSDIGRFCVIGANSVVRGDIPDYSVAVGAPARVVGSTRDRVSHLVAAETAA